MAKVLLIIPCFNEAKRLDPQPFKAASADISFCFANDGSSDQTLSMLQQAFSQIGKVSVFSSEKNLGKANIIRAAVLDQLKKGLDPEIEWVGFWDADLATPLEEVALFLRFQADFAPEAQAIFGSRVLRLGAEIIRSRKRHYLGRLFATFASVALGVKSYDSQCGAKIFRKDVLTKVFADEFLSRWIFDLEILLRLDEKNVVEVPLRRWHDVPGSKIKIYKEGFRVLKELYLIRKKYL